MSRITVTAAYTDLSGNPYSGRVTIQPTQLLQDLTNGVTIGTAGETQTLDGSGDATFANLPHTDDPTVIINNPAFSAWAYRVIEQVAAPGQTGFEPRAPYYILLPTSMGSGPVKLATIARFGIMPGFQYFPWGW